MADRTAQRQLEDPQKPNQQTQRQEPAERPENTEKHTSHGIRPETHWFLRFHQQLKPYDYFFSSRQLVATSLATQRFPFISRQKRQTEGGQDGRTAASRLARRGGAWLERFPPPVRMAGTYRTVRYWCGIGKRLATEFGDDAALMERWHEVGLGRHTDRHDGWKGRHNILQENKNIYKQ